MSIRTEDIEVIVDRLKKTKSRFGKLHTNEQALVNEIGIGHFLILGDEGGWMRPKVGKFSPNGRYRLRNTFILPIPDPRKEKYKKYPIYEDSRGMLVFDKWGTVKTIITDPETLTLNRWAGYEFPDEKLSSSLRRYKSGKTQSYYTMSLDSLTEPNSKRSIQTPVFMVFHAE